MSATPDPHVPDERDFIDSWACRHVEYDIPADDRADVARRFLARVKAEAWDEGAAHVEGRNHYDPDDNPYREDA